jgi:deoxyribodipyrimidine photo-lyase
VALAILGAKAPQAAKDAFLEQLIVRRELAVNFTARNRSYDSFDGLHPWARKTLEEHARDRRPALYTEEDLELGRTADPLWNAAQMEMVLTGRMHGYLRMYWAKKILEWTPHPAKALEIAVRFNDRWELDGRDPNGYTGVAWAIGGKHDRPWPERPVFGKIRFMSFASTSRKFGSKAYMARVARIAREGGLEPQERP